MTVDRKPVSTVARLSDFELQEADFTLELRLSVQEARDVASSLPEGHPLRRDVERHLSDIDDVLTVQDVMGS